MYDAIYNALQSVDAFMAGVWTAISPSAHFIWHILDSNFSAALWGALVGALAARYIARHVERRQRLRDEISGVNNAIALAVAITNTFVGMKRQHTAGMARMYEETFSKYVALPQNPNPTPVFEFITDFRVLQMPLTPITELREVILDRVKSSIPAISISVPLHQSIDGLATVLGRRQANIDRLRAMPAVQQIIVYFGLKNDEGNIDMSFSDDVNALISFVDHGIYFPMLLCEVLTAHGQALQKEYGKRAPDVKTI